ncbi:MAG: asparagine synthase (glutamine-hydrolyzing) [Flavobacteriales bacterium]|nr:asparagine synthase (glutamine-hydrolyzing) [Flavobacteriales bacterium]
MCGITGIIAKKKNSNSELVNTVNSMIQGLHHRGPDDEGSYNDDACALGMRRLSIIDLENGRQPIFNETKDVLVFQNGEIYNYKTLREELKLLGHQFSTQSDTEVLVHLYEEYGESIFSRLEGMFAICLYDIPKEKFILGRDALGEKPLYYHDSMDQFSFSSELKSLLENKKVPRKLNKEALSYYLRTSLIPAPITLFDGVMVLPPGHLLTIEKGEVSIQQYFTIEYKVNKDIVTVEDAILSIKPLLIKAVKKQTVSDVPIGAFLSGGIDSSTTVALLQQQSSKPIQSFTAKFEDQAYDESKIAKKVAEYCGTDHHELVIEDASFTENLFWEIIEHVGEPFRDSSAIPSYLLTKKIKEHVKVAISGDGGDELFGGYDLFQWYRKILRLIQFPKLARAAIQGAAGAVKGSGLLKNSSKLRQVDRALTTAQLDEDEILVSLNEMFTPLEMNALFVEESLFDQSQLCKRLKTYPKESENWSPLRKAMYYRSVHTLPSNMLPKVDRMSMANSLEVRAPFLDKNLFEAAAQLPDEFLIKDGVGKYLIREMMKNDLPESVFNHPKQGFNLPLQRYQNEVFIQLAKSLLFDENPMPQLFKKSELQRIFHQGIELKKDTHQISVFRASHQLWMMMQLFGWMKKFEVVE